MTTTAAAWRHGLESLVVRWCMAPGPRAGYCGCTTPTPDADSPCGWTSREAWGTDTCGTLRRPDAVHAHDAICPNDDWPEGCSRDFAYCHPRQPTLCTCGHSIKATITEGGTDHG